MRGVLDGGAYGETHACDDEASTGAAVYIRNRSSESSECGGCMEHANARVGLVYDAFVDGSPFRVLTVVDQ